MRSYLLPSSLPRTDVLHVGQSCDIACRLTAHVRDHEAAYPDESDRPTLHGVWAAVNQVLRDGVEAYIGKRLCPSGTYPDVPPVPVTMPLIA